MTEILLALIALIPALLGLASSRKRKIDLLQAEIGLYNAIPDSDEFDMSRSFIRDRITRSVEQYDQMSSTTSPLVRGLTGTLATLVSVVGYSFARQGDVNIISPEVVRGFGILLVFAGVAGWVMILGKAATEARDNRLFHLRQLREIDERGGEARKRSVEISQHPRAGEADKKRALQMIEDIDRDMQRLAPFRAKLEKRAWYERFLIF